jgi:hypothetical protein
VWPGWVSAVDQPQYIPLQTRNRSAAENRPPLGWRADSEPTCCGTLSETLGLLDGWLERTEKRKARTYLMRLGPRKRRT